jgi:hypothetical protein
MRSVVKYRIDEIIENKYGWDGTKSVVQKEAKMSVVMPTDKNDPNYAYGQLSGGSTHHLKTINPDVYNTWSVGAIVTCEMEVTPQS